MPDKLVVGYQQFVRTVAGRLATKDEHSCEQQTRPDYKAMAKALWNAGYRFDSEARVQWLAVHLRANMDKDLVDAFNEMLTLLDVEA